MRNMIWKWSCMKCVTFMCSIGGCGIHLCVWGGGESAPSLIVFLFLHPVPCWLFCIILFFLLSCTVFLISSPPSRCRSGLGWLPIATTIIRPAMLWIAVKLYLLGVCPAHWRQVNLQRRSRKSMAVWCLQPLIVMRTSNIPKVCCYNSNTVPLNSCKLVSFSSCLQEIAINL